jgi:hypothetical protein
MNTNPLMGGAAAVALCAALAAAAPMVEAADQPARPSSAPCSDPARFAGDGLASLAGCRSRHRNTDTDGYRTVLCIDASELASHDDPMTRTAFQNHCREMDTRLKGFAARPEEAVKFAAGMAVSQAWACLTAEATRHSWARDGFLGAMMGDAAYRDFAAPRLEGSALKEPCRGLIERGVMQSAVLSGEQVTIDRNGERPRWRYRVLAGLTQVQGAGSLQGQLQAVGQATLRDLPGKVLVEISGRFDPEMANDVNPLGSFIESWSEAPAQAPAR